MTWAAPSLDARSFTGTRSYSGQFLRERDMFAPVLTALPNVLFAAPTALAIVREASVGMVIPDLLVGRWPATRPVQRRHRSTIVEAHIVAALERVRRLSANALMARLGLPIDVAQRALQSLEGHRSVTRDGAYYRLVDTARTSDLELVAIELKLHRWRDALVQGARYRKFANRAYVILDAMRVEITSVMIQEFRKKGVGLYQQRGSVLELRLEARRKTPITSTRVRAADALFGDTPGQRHSCWPPKSRTLQTGLIPPSLEGR